MTTHPPRRAAKFRNPIEIGGTQNGSELTLTERLSDDREAGATMKLIAAGQQLKGRWTGKKQFTMQLAAP